MKNAHTTKGALCLFALALYLFPLGGMAQVPQMVNYQGRLVDGTNLVSSPVEMVLRLYDVSSLGTPLVEDSNTVTVVDGLYATHIGDDPTPTSGTLAEVMTNAELYLEIEVDGTVLAPRERVAAVCYALMAGGVPPGAVTTSMLADGAVTGPKVATGAISNAHLAVEAVGSGHVEDGSLAPADLDVASFATTFWILGGNAGTTPGSTHYLGTSDDQAIELRVNTLRALRVEPDAFSPRLIGGYVGNWASGSGTVIGGGGSPGQVNSVDATYATVAGGRGNTVGLNAHYSSIGGGEDNSIAFNAFHSTVGGGRSNSISQRAFYATLDGGQNNDIGDDAVHAAVGGGHDNHVGDDASGATISGGGTNTVKSEATYATIAGGRENTIRSGSSHGVISGGFKNSVAGASFYATIAGGIGNDIGTNATYSAIGGGFDNNVTDNSKFAVIPGGRECLAGGSYSFAAGRKAQAVHEGAFVWADSTDADFASTATNQFRVRAKGGVSIDTGNSGMYVGTGSGPGITLNPYDRAMITRLWDPFTNGNHFGAGRWGLFMEPNTLALGIPNTSGKDLEVVKYDEDGTWTSLMRVDQAGTVHATAFNPPSDRESKTDFEPVDPRAVLEELASIPIETWSFKSDAEGVQHMGPTAQDFRAAYGLGADDKHISTVDADGVALAAIQGLYQELLERDERIAALETRIAALEER